MGFFGKATIQDLKIHHSLAQRKRARILVIDDEIHAFPTELLKAEGYNVTYWEKVTNLAPLENGEFDLIVLDIHGITSLEQSTTGGLGILKHIKNYNPAQLVIAYSGKKYDLNEADFWKLADDCIAKPASLLKCKQRIDELLERKFSVEHYWEILKTILLKQDISSKDIVKLEKAIVKSTSKDSALTKQQISDTIKVSKDTLSVISVIVTLIYKLAKWTP